jgi:hypothetical protein
MSSLWHIPLAVPVKVLFHGIFPSKEFTQACNSGQRHHNIRLPTGRSPKVAVIFLFGLEVLTRKVSRAQSSADLFLSSNYILFTMIKPVSNYLFSSVRAVRSIDEQVRLICFQMDNFR